MNTPTITVEGKIYELPRLKCEAWRKFMAFEKNHNDVFAEDFIEARCEFLADIYGGEFTADTLLYNLYLEEIVKAYRDVTKYIIACLTPKLEEAEKNVDAGGKQAR